MSGRAQRVAVLSALVDKKLKSVGCQRPEMTRSPCEATTTEFRVWDKSPCKSVRASRLSYLHRKILYDSSLHFIFLISCSYPAERR